MGHATTTHEGTRLPEYKTLSPVKQPTKAAHNPAPDTNCLKEQVHIHSSSGPKQPYSQRALAILTFGALSSSETPWGTGAASFLEASLKEKIPRISRTATASHCSIKVQSPVPLARALQPMPSTGWGDWCVEDLQPAPGPAGLGNSKASPI